MLQVLLLVAALIWPTGAMAQAEVKGMPDPPGIGKRFPGATMIQYEHKEFDDFTLLTGPASKDQKTETVEGRITTAVYRIDKERTALEVARTYEDEMRQRGFEIVFQCAERACGGRGFNLAVMPYNVRFGGNESTQQYIAARKKQETGDLVAQLYVVKNTASGGASKNDVFARLVVIEEKEREARLETVTAEEIQSLLGERGTASLYGIRFDFDSATILPASRPVLDEVGKLLTASPGLRLFVVGHTDNEGELDYNLQLSRRRAQAVVTDLSSTYGIDPSRLGAQGLGPLAPVASNRSDDGRAKNRRVELVER
jgi:OOP family OmpA-OmpF porin